MKLSPEQLGSLFFRKNVNSSKAGEFTLDGNMMHILFAVKEDKPASKIVEETGLNSGVVAMSLSKLLEFGLIEKVESKVRYLDKDFFSALELNLKKVIGPMAEILMEEAIEESGLSRDSMLIEHGAAVVRTIASEISDAASKQSFIKIMAEYLR